jgi:four helix bundle protein
MQDFRNLIAWQKAHILALSVQRMTQTWPSRGNAGLVGQLRRSALSIPSNIAEGAGRGTDKEFASFIQIAIGSCSEAEYQLEFASQSGVGDMAECRKHMEQCREIRRILVGLQKRLRTPPPSYQPSGQ